MASKPGALRLASFLRRRDSEDAYSARVEFSCNLRLEPLVADPDEAPRVPGVLIHGVVASTECIHFSSEEIERLATSVELDQALWGCGSITWLPQRLHDGLGRCLDEIERIESSAEGLLRVVLWKPAVNRYIEVVAQGIGKVCEHGYLIDGQHLS